MNILRSITNRPVACAQCGVFLGYVTWRGHKRWLCGRCGGCGFPHAI